MVEISIDLRNINYQYPDSKQLIFNDLNLSVQSGQLVALVGPSGCGKTTLLRIISGLISDFSGTVFLDGHEEKLLGKAGLMPQDDLLLPWRTVLENSSLPLEIKGLDKDEIQKKVRPLLQEFGLEGYENAYPHQLSGGMRQRVAFLRNVLTGHKILLLDEPFSALDALTRLRMQEWLLTMWQRYGQTIIFITHDVEEAIFLAQRILLFSSAPNKSLKEYTVPFAYPRKRELLGNPAFVKLRQEILFQLTSGGSQYEQA